MKKWLGSSLNHIQGWNTVWESYSRALEQESLALENCKAESARKGINTHCWISEFSDYVSFWTQLSERSVREPNFLHLCKLKNYIPLIDKACTASPRKKLAMSRRNWITNGEPVAHHNNLGYRRSNMSALFQGATMKTKDKKLTHARTKAWKNKKSANEDGNLAISGLLTALTRAFVSVL